MASYEPINNKLNFAVSFNPITAFPLDARSIFGSKTAAEAAAATAENAGSTNTVYYYGMPLVVFENDVATMYTIQGDKTLKEVGSAPVPDNATIELTSGGALQLKDFGARYYAYHEADPIIEGSWTYPDGMPESPNEGDLAKVGEAWYRWDGAAWTTYSEEVHESDWYELTEGWKAGLEPKVVSAAGNTYNIAWYEPSTTTIEGISSISSNMQTEIDGFNTRLGDLETQVEELAAGGLVKVDETTITKGEDGTLSVKEIAQTQVTGLAGALSTATANAVQQAQTYADGQFVAKSNVVAAGAAASDVETASNEKVASEKLLVDQLTWKQGM